MSNTELFNSNGCLSEKALHQFIQGNLGEEARALVLRHAGGCPLCADALEGAKEFKSSDSFDAGISRLKSKRQKRGLPVKSMTLKIAAGLLLLIGLGLVLRNEMKVKDAVLLKKPSVSQIGKQNNFEETIEIELTDAEDASISGNKPVVIPPLPPKSTLVIAEVEPELDEIVLDEIDDVDLEPIKITRATEVRSDQQVSKKDLQDNHSQVATTTSSDSKTPKRKLSVNFRKDKARDAFLLAEVTPMFQGSGLDSFNSFVAEKNNIVIPDTVELRKVVISFALSENGEVSKVKLVSGTTSTEMNMMIVDYVKSSPVWVPGYLAGKPVKNIEQGEIYSDTSGFSNYQ